MPSFPFPCIRICRIVVGFLTIVAAYASGRHAYQVVNRKGLTRNKGAATLVKQRDQNVNDGRDTAQSNLAKPPTVLEEEHHRAKSTVDNGASSSSCATENVINDNNFSHEINAPVQDEKKVGHLLS